jgi:fatty acid desaturase
MSLSTVPRPLNRSREGGSDFAELRRRIDAAGLLDRRPGYYVLRSLLVAAVYGGGVVAFLVLGSSWWQLVVAAAMAVAFAQVALLAHDLAHRQIFRTRRPTELAGRLVGNLGIGMSYGWWMDKHTRHHANPNHEELDPDVTPEILVWSQRQARASAGLTRWIARRQALLFVPLLTLEGLNLHVSSLRALRRPGLRQRRLEAGLLVTHLVGYVSVLFVLLAPWQALAFLAVHQGLFGIYLGCAFAPNHKGMPTLTSDDELDYLRRQVITSRNVTGGPIVDVALGGLNYQIEHHLFPSMPTPNLAKAKPIVAGYCAEVGVPYCETGLLASYTEAFRHLHEAGAPLRGQAPHSSE